MWEVNDFEDLLLMYQKVFCKRNKVMTNNYGLLNFVITHLDQIY